MPIPCLAREASVCAPNEVFWDTALASCRNRYIWTLNILLAYTTFVSVQLQTSWKWGWYYHFGGWGCFSRVLCLRLFFDSMTSLTLLRHLTSRGTKGSPYSWTALFSQRQMLISYSAGIYKRGVKTKENCIRKHGSPQLGYFLLHLCSNNTQNEDPPPMVIFRLPFRSALRNFKESIMKEASKNHRNHTAFESTSAGGELRRLRQQVSHCLISYRGLALWMRNSGAIV